VEPELRTTRRRAVPVALALILAGATASAETLTVPLARLRVPVSAALDTVWDWRGEGERISPIAIDVPPSGGVWGIEARRHRVWLWGPPEASVRFAYGAGGSGTGGFAGRIFARSGLKVFTLDPTDAHIDRYDLLGVLETRLDLAAAVAAAGEDPIDAVDFCLSSSGDLFVLDRTRARVLQFDDRGRFTGVRAPSEVTGARAPVALEIDGRGRLFLLETRPPGLILLEIDGRVARRALPAGDGERPQPVSLAVDPWGNAFVGDRRGGCVLVAPEGGSPGWRIAAPEGPLRPTELAADGARLLVADAPGERTWVFSLDYATEGPSGGGAGTPR
jgi:hypothetical protein